MDIQKELREWADRTAKGYVAIANDLKDKAPSFYTQSDLTKITGKPEVIVLGINPGSDGLYNDQKTSKGWDLNGGDMDGEHLIHGNYFKESDRSSWDDREKWLFWWRLKAYFKDVLPRNPLEKEEKFVLTNMSFFNSKKANHLPNKLLIQSIPYSLDLIKLLAPPKIVFLGGGGMLEKLNRVNRTKIFDINYEMTAPGIYKGQFNGFPFLAVPHPSAYLTSEYRQTVVDNITAFMN
jgi:hypothetical protein